MPQHSLQTFFQLLATIIRTIEPLNLSLSFSFQSTESFYKIDSIVGINRLKQVTRLVNLIGGHM